ncbi:hypothetical protein Sep02g_05830 [Staphylococcus epidermidis]|nr:hypothetical protein Sep02g_05830 [Staphylococcus epidermidis]BFF28615.1 hypothetical protein KUHPSE03_05960 [Staphylococcus epidermidis]BFF30916.1 hypothetical protein KUHPSE08_05540 [Staphylococcus epidermidis]
MYPLFKRDNNSLKFSTSNSSSKKTSCAIFVKTSEYIYLYFKPLALNIITFCLIDIELHISSVYLSIS